MKHKLLVAVDGSKHSGRTVLYAARACAGHGKRTWGIVLFHVLVPPPRAIQRAGKPDAAGDNRRLEYEKQAREAAKRMLAEMKTRLGQEGVTTECVSARVARQRGRVADRILAVAEEENCDTIVVGRQGRSMLGQFLAGSVVEQLLRNPIAFSVWVVE
jgi:nucleotide-binding universal stress UspA family protein